MQSYRLMCGRYVQYTHIPYVYCISRLGLRSFSFPSVWPGKCNTTEFGNQLHRSQMCTKYDCYFVYLFFLSKEVKIFVFDVVIRSRLKLGNTKTLICFYCTGFFFRLRKYTCNQAHVSTTDLQYKTNHSRGKKGNKIQTYF